ncbi:MAG: hypothetical protein UIH99_02530 [Alphaproteobacteria bacterium]|jgi:hypothetical protein|nr:hypothetical protein [Alphaproteobacteria bacterium]
MQNKDVTQQNCAVEQFSGFGKCFFKAPDRLSGDEQEVALNPEIIGCLKKMGFEQNGRVWLCNNIKIEFSNVPHITFYINDRPVQGYTGLSNITRVLKEHSEF